MTWLCLKKKKKKRNKFIADPQSTLQTSNHLQLYTVATGFRNGWDFIRARIKHILNLKDKKEWVGWEEFDWRKVEFHRHWPLGKKNISIETMIWRHKGIIGGLKQHNCLLATASHSLAIKMFSMSDSCLVGGFESKSRVTWTSAADTRISWKHRWKLRRHLSCSTPIKVAPVH